MDEMKLMLVKLCEGQEELFKDVKKLSEGQEELFKDVKKLSEGQEELFKDVKKLVKDVKRLDEGQNEIRQEMAEGLSKVREDILAEVLPEIRAVNQRLAACQLENGKKVDVLFDADETRRQLLEIHDEEIPEIKSTLFNYDIRIKNLESKVIGT